MRWRTVLARIGQAEVHDDRRDEHHRSGDLQSYVCSVEECLLHGAL